jgi:hypothetical protein
MALAAQLIFFIFPRWPSRSPASEEEKVLQGRKKREDKAKESVLQLRKNEHFIS